MLFVQFENGSGICVRAVQRTDGRGVIMPAEKIIRLGAHHHLDCGFIAQVIFFSDQRRHFIKMFFVGHLGSHLFSVFVWPAFAVLATRHHSPPFATTPA
jgi:hypothetical protein